MLLKQSLTAALMLGAATAASAHATWIAQRSGEYAVVHGEGSATDEAYKPEIVSAPLAFDKSGAPLAVTLNPLATSMQVKPAEGSAILSVVYDEGWWTEDAKGEWHNAPADGFVDFKGTGHYSTYPVAYIAATDAQKPVGHLLEIVPLADPTKLSMGDKLEVLVLLEGKPVEGVAVTNDVLTDWDISSTLTDAEGKATVTVANNGLNVLQYYHEVKVSDKEVAGHQAVLSFVAGGPAEE
jgi:nickel transport protein